MDNRLLKKILTTLIGCATLALVIVICYDVIMRYIFSSGSVALQELEWHLFSFIILFGGVVVLIENSHVRVDLIFNSSIYTERTREVVNCIGNLVFLIPFCLIIIWASYPFIYDSFIHSEKSPDPGGLTNRWIVKSFILLSFGLAAVIGITQIVRSVNKLCKKDD